MSKNPLIQDLIENEAFPAVSIALPSGGRWYEKNVLEEGIDPLDVPVGVLGVLAEQNYRDPWLILSGESIPRMLRTVCPVILKPDELCEIDLEAILLAARLVSYGSTLEIIHTCVGPKPESKDEKEKTEDTDKPDKEGFELTCAFKNTVIIDVDEHIMRYAPMEDAAVTNYTLKLERFNQTVQLRPMPYKNVIGLIKDNIQRERQFKGMDEYGIDDLVTNPEALKKYTQIVDMTTDSSVDSIVASIFCVDSAKGQHVNGEEFIKEWLLALSIVEVELITTRINELAAERRKLSEIKFGCEECGHENVFSLELDAQRLFGSAGASKTPKQPSRKSKRSARKKKTSSRVLRP